jgi:hypothetical protein
MIFHFVEIGDCETLAKCRFGVGGCPDIARSVTLLPLCMSVTELQEYVEALNRTDNLVTELLIVDCQPRLVRNPARILKTCRWLARFDATRYGHKKQLLNLQDVCSAISQLNSRVLCIKEVNIDCGGNGHC